MIGFMLNCESGLPGEISKLQYGAVVDCNAHYQIRRMGVNNLEVSLGHDVNFQQAEGLFGLVLGVLGNYGISSADIDLGVVQPAAGHGWVEPHVPFGIRDAYQKAQSSIDARV